jgi:hypothetical protein
MCVKIADTLWKNSLVIAKGVWTIHANFIVTAITFSEKMEALLSYSPSYIITLHWITLSQVRKGWVGQGLWNWRHSTARPQVHAPTARGRRPVFIVWNRRFPRSKDLYGWVNVWKTRTEALPPSRMHDIPTQCSQLNSFHISNSIPVR